MVKRNCIICNKEFEVLWNAIPQRYCSKQCWLDDLRSKKPIVNCAYCGKEFRPFPADILRGKAKFCGRSCSIEYNKKIHSIEKICKGCGKFFIVKTYRQFDYCSQKCFMDNVNPFKKMVGINHPNWKGGHGKEGRKYSAELNKWKRKVLKRDNYRCVYCGSGERLEVDHKWSYSVWPELATKMWNGQTLCHKCHKKTVNYGYKNNKFYQEMRLYIGIPNRKTPSPDKIIRIKNQLLKKHPELLQDRLI